METRSQDLTLRTRALEKELFVTSAWGPKGEPELQLSSGLRVGRAERILQSHPHHPHTPTREHLARTTCPGWKVRPENGHHQQWEPSARIVSVRGRSHLTSMRARPLTT